MMGLGCVGGVALLSRANDYLKTYPQQLVMTVTAESGSRFWSGTLQHSLEKLFSAPNFEKEKILQQVLSAALFGDALSCSVLVGSEHPYYRECKLQNPLSGPAIVDSESMLVPNSIDFVQHTAESGGIQSYLHHGLGGSATISMANVVKALLAKNNLRKDDVSLWFIHPGGPKILEGFQSEFSLSQQQMKYCWNTLSEAGNISSATVLRIYESTMAEQSAKIAPGTYGVMVAAGPGLLIEAVLLKW